VDAEAELSANVVAEAGAVVIRLLDDGGKPLVVLRKIAYAAPDVALAVQLRLTTLEDVTVALSAVGGVGAVGADIEVADCGIR
jgi:hypothetical protein